MPGITGSGRNGRRRRCGGCHAESGQRAFAQSSSARPGRLTLVVEGDLAACRAALDAGSAAAQRTGRVISRKEIGRPEEDTQWLIGGFARATTPTEKAPQVPATPEFAEALLALLASVRQGMTAGEVAAHFGWPLEQARNVLEQLFSDGALRKRSSRYRIKN